MVRKIYGKCWAKKLLESYFVLEKTTMQYCFAKSCTHIDNLKMLAKRPVLHLPKKEPFINKKKDHNFREFYRQDLHMIVKVA